MSNESSRVPSPDLEQSRVITTVTGLGQALVRLTRTTGFAETPLPAPLVERNREIFGESLTAGEVVDRVLHDVHRDGDSAVRKYTEAFDRHTIDDFEVPRVEWQAALDSLDDELRAALTLAAGRIEKFHRRQPGQSWIEPDDLGMFGQLVRPISRVGIYAPGGSAALPSSLLMIAVPARVAGVKEVIVAAPPRHNGDVEPVILAASLMAGVDRVFRIGGAQAIAGLAYGTESIPKVDKVLGPGNIFVALAKQRVYGDVDIDQIAGPTETMIVADRASDPELTAADMLAQAEHDPQASAILVTTSADFAAQVEVQLRAQLPLLERQEIALESLRSNGLIAVVESETDAIAVANAYAPEHLCLLVADPWSLIPKIQNAAGIFVGEHSPEALGDYTAGPSHVMPTGGTARYSSPVNVRDFQKVISVVAANRDALAELGPATIRLANAEGLGGHAAAIQRRLDKRKR